MTACRERIVAAAATALATIAGFSGLVVERDREREIDTDELPRIVLAEGSETLTSDLTGEDGWTLVLIVSGYVKAASATAAATEANRLRAAIQKALRADVTLGGLARDLRPEPEEECFPIDLVGTGPAKCFALAFAVDYATEEGDPETFASHA